MLLAMMTQADPFGDGLNEFAQAYNRFIEKLRQGHFDQKLWRECEKKWRRLAPCEKT
jgi:hypothetical protein